MSYDNDTPPPSNEYPESINFNSNQIEEGKFAAFETDFVQCPIEELFSVQFRKGAHIFVIIGVVVPTLLLLLPLLAHIVVNQYY